jgi:hypothetical protein
MFRFQETAAFTHNTQHIQSRGKPINIEFMGGTIIAINMITTNLSSIDIVKSDIRFGVI